MERNYSEPPKQDIPGAIDAMIALWSGLAEQAASLAHAKRTIYLAYIAEGFSEQQALELVKSP